jgi:CheY-like chemotaxis protein
MNSAVECEEPRADAPVVMVVDDDILIRMVIAKYLRECQLTVIEAASAAEACAVLSAAMPVDVVLADAQLSGEMDGFTLARWIRSHHSGVSIILASTMERKAEAAGELCDEGPLLARPYDTAAVERQVRMLIAGRRSDRKRTSAHEASSGDWQCCLAASGVAAPASRYPAP